MNTTRVYRYGLLAPRNPEEHALALQLLGQASNYSDDIRRVHARAAARRKLIVIGEAEASHVKLWEKRLTSEELEARKLLTKLSYETLDETRNAEIRAARAKRGHLVDAGTYWLVEDAALAAAKASGLDGPRRASPFDGTGRIGAMIQSTEQFLLPDPEGECAHCYRFRKDRCHHQIAFGTKRFRVAPAEASKDSHDFCRHHTLTIKVGDLKSNRSITWPMTMFQHRSLPSGAKLLQVAVQRLRRGHRFVWEVLFTVSFEPAVADVNASGVVGIDVGWRLEREDHMRVATHDGLRDGESEGPHGRGDAGILAIDAVRSFRYADAVEGFRDNAFNDAKAFVQETGLPGAEHAKQWRNKGRLHQLAIIGRTQRLPAGMTPADLGANMWRERDRHLEDISTGVRGKAVRRRKEAFASYADQLAKRYRVAVLEDMPMQDWVGEAETAGRERLRSIASLSFLQKAIVHRFGNERVHWVPAKNTSRTCADCGAVHPESVGAAPEWICQTCGVVHHQDENAAVILRRMGERWIGDGNPVCARSRKSSKQPGKTKTSAARSAKDTSSGVIAREPFSNAAE